MAEIGFYHLTRTGLMAALPQLLGRALQTGEKALVLCARDTQVGEIDEALWRAVSPDWLPHGTAATPHPEWQPVYITAKEVNPAGARFLFLVHGAETPNLGGYARVFDLFDGNNAEELGAARLRWKAAKAGGHVMAYWKQSERGWEKAA